MKDLVDKFNPGPEEDHFGLITFSRKANTEFTFADSDYQDKETLKQGIANSLVKPGRGTRTDLAMRAALELFQGDRPSKPNIMIVLTDGKPHGLRKTTFEEFAKKIAKSFEVSMPRLSAADI